MTDLDAADFGAFMREVTGFDPFPWQQRLLNRVLHEDVDRAWPQLLNLPTGTGKTSALLVALYALALAPERSARRIALVVDRRIIVDQIDGFARKIREALLDAQRPICAKVAARLRALSSRGEPVKIVHLRGGVPRDDSWLSAPDQPTIIASTVDQVGSRLLFRGYGVSESMRPVHAGILARDTLYFLDEVHLATAFEETLDRLERTYSQWPERDVGRHFRIVRMSATPRGGIDDIFDLDEDDRAHPLLAKRLNASRPAILEQVKTKRGSNDEIQASNRTALANAACARAREAAKAGARAIGLVFNRVDTARRAAARLCDGGEKCELVTGRMRPFDRTEIQAKLERTVASGAVRSADEPPFFVVATSCIEAGADFDFDALITEAASLDALRQRFGRLNRLGNHPSTWAWVLVGTDQIGASATEHFAYGWALRDTWAYLEKHAQPDGKLRKVDFGLSAFVEPKGEDLEGLLPKIKEAPVLFPSYLDMWSETRPAPHPDPDPALWLHGKEATIERDINVVFRADIPASTNDEQQRAIVEDSLEFLPPVADEAVSVPLREFRDWVGEQTNVWCWSADGVEAVPAAKLRVGATVVVAASGGGLGLGTWDPRAKEAVVDVAELAFYKARKVAKIRLDAGILPPPLSTDIPRPTDSDDPDEIEAAHSACLTWLHALDERVETVPESWRDLLRDLANSKARRVLSLGLGLDGKPIWRVTVVNRPIEATTEDSISSFSGVEVTLKEHLEDVEAWAGAFARMAGLDPAVASDVALAGRLHDLGKADIRFQALLRGGEPIATSDPLAKSRLIDARARERARRRSGWPGLRHELISLALLDASAELQARANDLELVRHLVASHHGWCRPWAPTTVDPEPTLVHFEVAGIHAEVSTAALEDSFFGECASRFRRLCRRYGWHGLAYLEALLRLGDHRASEKPGTDQRPKAEA